MTVAMKGKAAAEVMEPVGDFLESIAQRNIEAVDPVKVLLKIRALSTVGVVRPAVQKACQGGAGDLTLSEAL